MIMEDENPFEKCISLNSSLSFSPSRAKFFIGNMQIYLQFISFIDTNMTQAVEILPHVG